MNTRASRDHSAYVPTDQTPVALERLDLMFTERKLCLLSGLTGSGRHALYKYWLEGRWTQTLRPKEKANPGDVLYAYMGSTIYAGAKPARQLLSCVRDQVRKNGRPAYTVKRNMGRPEGGLVTSRDLEKAFREIIKGLENQRKRLIVIDNAHLLDADGLNLALELSHSFDAVTTDPHRLRAMLLIAYTEGCGDKNKVWNLIKANRLALASAVYPAIELERLNDTTIPKMFVRLLKSNLGADFDSREAPVVRALKQHEFLGDILRFTGGDWTRMQPLIGSLHEHLGIFHEGKPRVLTDDVMAAVRAELTVMAKAGIGESIEDKPQEPKPKTTDV